MRRPLLLSRQRRSLYYQVKHSVTETATKERPGGNVTGRVFFILIYFIYLFSIYLSLTNFISPYNQTSLPQTARLISNIRCDQQHYGMLLSLTVATVATVWIGTWEIILFSPDGNRINETVKPVLSVVRKKLKFTIKLWYFSWKLQW